jgi:hypothetical protein
VNLVAEALNRGLAARQHDRLVEVRQLALGFRVYPVGRSMGAEGGGGGVGSGHVKPCVKPIWWV